MDTPNKKVFASHVAVPVHPVNPQGEYNPVTQLWESNGVPVAGTKPSYVCWNTGVFPDNHPDCDWEHDPLC